MFESILSLPVSVALLVWIWRMKKDDPFPKGTFIRLIIAGFVSGILSAIVTIFGSLAIFISSYGLDTLKSLFNVETAMSVVEQLKAAQSNVTSAGILMAFIRTFILVGFVEEIFKFLCAKAVMRKKGVTRTWMDALLCFAVVAIAFQFSEDMGYSSGNIITAIVRALTPFHFTFAAIMGYYYGLAKTTGNRFYYFLALFIPSLLHTVFDFSINTTQYVEEMFLLVMASAILLLVLTIVMIVKIRKWHKNKTLDKVI